MCVLFFRARAATSTFPLHFAGRTYVVVLRLPGAFIDEFTFCAQFPLQKSVKSNSAKSCASVTIEFLLFPIGSRIQDKAYSQFLLAMKGHPHLSCRGMRNNLCPHLDSGHSLGLDPACGYQELTEFCALSQLASFCPTCQCPHKSWQSSTLLWQNSSFKGFYSKLCSAPKPNIIHPILDMKVLNAFQAGCPLASLHLPSAPIFFR